MSIYRKRQYRKIWEEHNNACIMPGMHIHHKDGNKHNNDPLNLLLCTPEEHFYIHLKQGDVGAALFLWKNFLDNVDLKIVIKLASENMKKIHKKMKIDDPKKYSEWQQSRALGKKRNDNQKLMHKIGAQKRLSDPYFRKRLSESCKGPRKRKTCPHFGKIGAGGNMSRYHFNNCKERKVI